MFHLDLFQDILKLNIGVSQRDNDTMFSILNSIYPLQIHSYPSGLEHNGWIVPPYWKVDSATISRNKQIIFDAARHPLNVIGLSTSFQGTITKSELDKHVFFRDDLPEAIAFHSMNNYRPWARDWGFCIPASTYKAFDESEYTIDLRTQYIPGEMLVGECFHSGESQETIVLNAHTCHPCQFNDGFSGVAVLLAFFRWLAGRRTKYSYLGLLAPEHLGSVFFLSALSKERIGTLKMALFLEMLGIDQPFALQESFFGSSIADRVLLHLLNASGAPFRTGRFREIVGNDETVWEAPGVEVPCVSLSRCYRADYYPQYHTNQDDLGITSEPRLREALDLLIQATTILESDAIPTRRFDGLVALSNPKYGLYIERPDPTVKKNLSEADLLLGGIQDRLPRFFSGRHSVLEISEQLGVPHAPLLRYLQQFESKDLLDLRPVPSLDHYAFSGIANSTAPLRGEHESPTCVRIAT